MRCQRACRLHERHDVGQALPIDLGHIAQGVNIRLAGLQLAVDGNASCRLQTRCLRQGNTWTQAHRRQHHVGVQALEVMGEFAPVFGRMKIDGAAAVDFVARSFAEGLVPTIDRGAELLEEFQIRITDLDSQDAIKQLGVDFQVVSDLLARGEGAKALEMVTSALLDMKDKSQQATLANIIFGAAMESAFDRPELIARLHNLATEQLNVAGASAKATENAKAMQTEWDKSKRSVDELASKVGVACAAWRPDAAPTSSSARRPSP